MHGYVHVYVCMCMYACICVCVCVCVHIFFCKRRYIKKICKSRCLACACEDALLNECSSLHPRRDTWRIHRSNSSVGLDGKPDVEQRQKECLFVCVFYIYRRRCSATRTYPPLSVIVVAVVVFYSLSLSWTFFFSIHKFYFYCYFYE